MSVESEIERIENNIANTYDVMESVGAEMPSTRNSANLASTAATIPTGTPLPDQTGHAGEFLTTNGTNTSWDSIGLSDIATAGSGISFNSAETENFTIVGSPTFTSKVVSNFSNSNYLILPQSAAQMGYTLYCKFTTGSSFNNNRYIYDKEGFDALWITSSRNLITWNWSQNKWVTIKSSVPYNTTYWVKVVLETNKRTYYVSTDGTNYDSGTIVNDTAYAVGSNTFYVGYMTFDEPTWYWNGTIDLNDWRIELNNEVIWTPYSQSSTKKIISANVDQVYSGSSTNAQSGVAVKSAIDNAISSVYKPAGSSAFASLPALSSSIEGYVYNINEEFTTDANFVEGAGKTYPAGTNVVCIDVGSSTYKWDVLAGYIAPTHLTDLAIAGNNITFTNTYQNNVTLVGSPTVNGTVISNMSSSNYAIGNYTFTNAGPFAWKAVVKFTTGSSVYGIQRAFVSKLFSMHLDGNCLTFEVWSSGISPSYYRSISVSSNTTYLMSIEFDGTNTYTYKYSTNNGQSWAEATTPLTGTFCTSFDITSTLDIGQDSTSQNDFHFQGAVDLKETYFEINGTEVWRGATQTGLPAINATVPTIDQTYNASSANAQSGVAINGAGFLKNATTQTNGLAILGTTTAAANATAIGKDSLASYITTAVGTSSQSYGIMSTSVGAWSNAGTSASVVSAIAIGAGSQALASGAILLGNGTNSEAKTFKVALTDAQTVHAATDEASGLYTLLNSDGTIPTERLAEIIISGASNPTTSTTGTIGLLYKNTTSGAIFKCTAIDNTDPQAIEYTWEELGAGGGSGEAETYSNPALTSVSNICTWTVSHTLNTKDFVANVYNISTGKEVMYEGIRTSNSVYTINLQSDTNIAANTYKVVMVKSGGSGGSSSLNTESITIQTTDWSANSYIATVQGMTADKVVWVSPAPSSATDYSTAGILCTAQGTDELTFTCTSTPSNDVTINVIFN